MASKLCLVALLLTTGYTEAHNPITPDFHSAHRNANLVFNAIHSAGRQWGSSLSHNGFGFFPAIMPRGTLLYHGASRNETPEGPEWLAFEIEHAENFARSHRGPRHKPRRPPPKRHEHGEQIRLTENGQSISELDRQRDRLPDSNSDHGQRPDPGYQRPGDNDTVNYRGYLHTYQTSRDLNLLLIDGMSAGKTNMGTLDSQDLVLRENSTNGGFDEQPRAVDLCELVTEWGFDGVVRMEVGFEVIHCDFRNSLDLVTMKRTMMRDDMVGDGYLSFFPWARAATERYDGIGGDRLRIDWSSMVSGLFFPINISSIDANRPDLTRLAAAAMSDLKDIKGYLKDVATAPRRFNVDWQATVDLIVARFVKPLKSMTYEDLLPGRFIDEVEAATLLWVDAPGYPDDVTAASEEGNRTEDAVAHCRAHFLRPSTFKLDEWSLEDRLIYTSIDAVMEDICSNLFSVREVLLKASGSTWDAYHIGRVDDEGMSEAIKQGRRMLQRLMETLGWTAWKQTQPCGPDEVLFIAMWPFGTENDHFNPGCRSLDGLQHAKTSYWRRDQGPRRDGRDKED